MPCEQLTQTSAARMAKISINTWQRAEAGQPVRPSTLRKIAAALKVNPAELSAGGTRPQAGATELRRRAEHFQTTPPVQWGDIMAYAAMMALPLLLVFLIFQRYFVKGVASAGLKG